MAAAWSERQQAIIAIVPKFSASLSIMGSSCIIAECLFRDRRKLGRVYHRLLLTMSCYDVLESSWNFCSTWPIPRGTPNVAFASGNVTSCTIQGFILEFGLAIPILNMCLSIYYLLVIKYSWSETKIRKRAEPWFHGVSLGVALSFAIAGIAMKLYNNANLWCWFAPLPLDCKDSFRYGDEANCIRGDNAWIYRWAFYYIPLWFCILFVMFAMLAVYLEVRRLEKANRKFEFRASSGHIQPQEEEEQGQQQSRKRSLFRKSSSDDGLSRQSLTYLFRRASSSTLAEERKRPSKSRQVATQALFYVGAFYMTFTFATINRLIQQIAGKTFFATTVLHTIFEPSQGFFNYLVYLRPRYLNYKEKNPNVPWYKALTRVIFPDDETFARRKSSRYVDNHHEDEELARTELQRYRRHMASNETRKSAGVRWFVEGDETEVDDSGKTLTPTDHTRATNEQVSFSMDQENDGGEGLAANSEDTPRQARRVSFVGVTAEQQEEKREISAPSGKD